jgi:hypothetical protein
MPSELPEMLYHYTTLEGLLGILESKSIWATHIRYLNDAAEFNYAKDLIADGSRMRSNESSDQSKEMYTLASLVNQRDQSTTLDGYVHSLIERNASNELLMLLELLHRAKIFVCCFSESRDQLSQWRAYSPKGNGVCIGFNTALFIPQMEKKGFRLIKCVYEWKEQVDRLNRFIDKFHQEQTSTPRESKESEDKLEPLIRRYGEDLFGLTISLKHESFKEESEWRFGDIKPGQNDLKFRLGKSMLIPYHVIPLTEGETALPISEIIIGPSPNIDLSREAVETLLQNHGLETCEVKLSGTPYRTW